MQKYDAYIHIMGNQETNRADWKALRIWEIYFIDTSMFTMLIWFIAVYWKYSQYSIILLLIYSRPDHQSYGSL